MKKATLRLLACAAALWLVAGCATPARPRPQQQAPTPQPPSIGAFSANPFLSVELPPSRVHPHEEAVKALGRPLEVVTKDAPSPHDPTIVNSLITLRYPFGELLYLRIPQKAVENLILIRLTGSEVSLKYGIRIGESTREQILKLFGPPQDTQDNSVSYNALNTQEITNSTTFFFRDTVLIQVDISSLMMD